MKKKSKRIKPMAAKRTGASKSYPLPEPTTTSLNNNNEFLLKFITDTYSYKQKSDLRVSDLRIICYILEFDGNPEDLQATLRLIVEMEKNAETLVLNEATWNTSKSAIDAGTFQSQVAQNIQKQYHLIMRHGLATVIRTAQKQEADIIL